MLITEPVCVIPLCVIVARQMYGSSQVERYWDLGIWAAYIGNCLLTFRDNLSIPSSRLCIDSILKFNTSLKTGPIGCPETSVKNGHCTLLNVPGERGFQLPGGRNFITHEEMFVNLSVIKLKFFPHSVIVSFDSDSTHLFYVEAFLVEEVGCNSDLADLTRFKSTETKWRHHHDCLEIMRNFETASYFGSRLRESMSKWLSGRYWKCRSRFW